MTGAYSLEQLLAERHWVHRLARRLVTDADDADDLVQETWLAAMHRPPATGSTARPWLATVTRNAATTLGLARRRRRSREAEAELARDPVEPPEELVARFETQRLLAELVAGLAEPFRQTLLLRYYAGHSAAEIAVMLGAPAGTVRWRLKRALDELRAKLDERTGGRRTVWMAALVPVAPAASAPGAGPLQPAARAAGGRPAGTDLGPQSPRGTTAVAAVAAVAGLAAIAVWINNRDAAPHPGGATFPAEPGSRASGQPLRFSTGAGRPFGMPPSAATAASFVLHGRVVDPGGRPVPGAAVRAFRQRSAMEQSSGDQRDARPAITGPDGVFALVGLPPGYHNLSASAPGFAVAGLASVDVASQGAPALIEIRLARGGAILAGQVLDVGGGPIAGATVRIDSVGEPGQAVVTRAWIYGPAWIHGHTITTDAQGSYQLQLAPFVYSVGVRASGYAPRQIRVDLRANQTRDVHLEPGGSIAGRVVTASDGQPLAAAEVFAMALGGSPASGRAPGWQRVKPTDEEGRFQVGPLSPGLYTLIARHAELVGELAQPVLVTPGVDAPIQIAVDPGLTVTGTVHADRRPVAHTFVRLYPVARTAIPDGIPHGRTDAAGGFRLSGVLPGEYRLEVPGANPTRGGGGYGPFSTRLLVQRSMTQDVELPRATRVTGVVLTSAGRPAAQAIVEVLTQEHIRTRADAAGHFSFQGLEPGPLSLVARLGDEATRSTILALGSGQHEEVVLTLTPAARISGTVTSEDGTPAANFPLMVVPPIRSDLTDLTTDLRSGGDGRFSIGGLPPGEVALVATAPEADPAPPARGSPASAFVSLTAGEHRTDVRLVVPLPSGVKDARASLPAAGPGGAPRAGN